MAGGVEPSQSFTKLDLFDLNLGKPTLKLPFDLILNVPKGF